MLCDGLKPHQSLTQATQKALLRGGWIARQGKAGEVKSHNAGKAVTSSVAYAGYATASRREALK